MQCQICNKNFAEFQCSKCGKIICFQCHTRQNNKILCKGCYSSKPEKHKKLKKEPDIKESIKAAILTLLILMGGMLFITYYLRNYLSSMEVPFDVEPLIAVIDAFGSVLIFGI